MRLPVFLMRLLSEVLSVLRWARPGRASTRAAMALSERLSQYCRLSDMRDESPAREARPASVTEPQLPRSRDISRVAPRASASRPSSVTEPQPRRESSHKFGCAAARTEIPASDTAQNESPRQRSWRPTRCLNPPSVMPRQRATFRSWSRRKWSPISRSPRSVTALPEMSRTPSWPAQRRSWSRSSPRPSQPPMRSAARPSGKRPAAFPSAPQPPTSSSVRRGSPPTCSMQWGAAASGASATPLQPPRHSECVQDDSSPPLPAGREAQSRTAHHTAAATPVPSSPVTAAAIWEGGEFPGLFLFRQRGFWASPRPQISLWLLPGSSVQ
mmetsp:Transcript_40885/g.97165  ORF Transcript_40885/g.97165 Transcript_40885/m.97165 type:complete len:327 (-) Transcript_40885:278-1258(-)